MLKTNNILLSILLTFFLFICGCKTIPEGIPPDRAVEIEPSVQGEKITLNEAVNLASTELAVKVFSGRQGVIKVLFKNNQEGDAVTRRLYNDLKIFQPVKSVLENEDFILESNFFRAGENKFWQLRLKNRQGQVIWNEKFAIKEDNL